MKPGSQPKFPESNAVACTVQNMSLTTFALGRAGYWCLGYYLGMKEYLSLGPDNQCLAFFVLGRSKDSEHYPKGSRKSGW